MSFRGDDRGQAIQIGAVLLFAVLVIAFSLFQAFVVPNQNEQVEMDHSVKVQQQLQELRNAIVSMPGETSGTATTITLGTSYPTRIFALNPPPPSGRLSTIGTTNPQVTLSITNATATGETGDVWNGTTRSYNTGGIVYKPDYNRYRHAPTTIYENTVLYNRFAEGTLTLAGQSLISGNRISLITLNGSLSRSSSTTTTVDVRPISSSEQTILVSGNASSPITLNLTTRLSASRWVTLLDGEENVDTVALAPNADAVPDPFTRVQITLKPGQYRLQMTKVGVGTGATAEAAAYLTDVAGNGTTITRGESQEITLEVRDAYNNPVSGVTVNGTVSGTNAGQLRTTPRTTDVDGRVTFVYNSSATTTADTHEIRFSLRNIGTDYDRTGPQNVSAYVTVEEPPQAGGGGSSGPYSVSWADPSAMSENSGDDITCTDGECTWDVGASDDATLQLNVTTQPPYEGVEMDFAVNDSTVASLSPSSGTTNGEGIASSELTAEENGTVSLFASGGTSGDVLNISVTNVSIMSGPSLNVRLDDLTDLSTGQPTLIGSYSVDNTNSSFSRVEVTFGNVESPYANASFNESSQRGGVLYDNGGRNDGSEDTYQVTFEVVYSINGNERVVAEKTITDIANAQNPTGNAELANTSSAQFVSWEIRDKSNNGNGARYRFDYEVGGGSFSEVILGSLRISGSTGTAGGSELRTRTSRSGQNIKINPSDGWQEEYRSVILIRDAEGVVVALVDVEDSADGSGTFSGP